MASSEHASGPATAPLRFARRAEVSFDPNPLTRALDEARARGRRVIDLTVSNPTEAGIPYAREAILDALRNEAALTYEPTSFGAWSAREAVAAEYAAGGVLVSAEQVMLTASTSEAYAFLFKVLCDPGDQVLVPQPSYPLFEHLARLESVELVPYRLAYDGAWHLDLDSVRAAKGPRTRAILVVSPNNPTGSYLKKPELAALLEHGLPIVSDEVFSRYPLADGVFPDRVSSVAQAAGGLLFALGGLSKSAALPQMKAAWTAIAGEPLRVRAALARLELVADAFLSVGSVVQHALPRLLASREVAWRAIQARTRANLAALGRAMGRGSAATLLTVEGGWYATLRLPTTETENAWARGLLLEPEEAGVYVHPGHFFDFPEEAYAIVSLLTPEPEFREGVSLLLRHVERRLR